MWKRGLEDIFLWGTRHGTHMESLSSTGIVLLQEGDAEDRKHILAELEDIKC